MTVEALKHISTEYEVICFSGHGCEYDGSPVLCLREFVTNENRAAYAADLKNNRVISINTSYGNYYWVFPSFFEEYYNESSFSNSFVFAESCCFCGSDYTSLNYEFENAFLSNGAKAIVGFYNPVFSDYSRDFMTNWIGQLVDGDTAGVAFDGSVEKYGPTDGGKPEGTPIFQGDRNARLVDEGLKNGSFELASTPKYWTTTGDVRVITKLGNFIPEDGKRMAILSTGFGSKESDYLAGTEGSILSQKFRVPNDVTTLSFTYNVVSEEPFEYVGSQYDDKFLVNIKDEKAEKTQITFESVNTSVWLNEKIPEINFEGGDETTYQTGWKTVSYDISQYAGKIITLEFVVFDVGDSIYDTAALIDNAKLS